MTRIGTVSTIAALIAGLVASWIIHQRSLVALRAGEARLRDQTNQISALTLEHERLAKLASHPMDTPSSRNAAELAKLRNEVGTLQKRTNDLGRTLAAQKDLHRSRPVSSNSAPRSPEYYEQLHQMAGSKPTEARDLSRAYADYADDHQKQPPQSLDQLLPYLAKNGGTLSGGNQYEIIYHGSLDQLQGLPWGSIAVIRDTQPWPGPDGTLMRTYGFPDGHSQIIIDNLPSWISEHVIAPTAPVTR